MSKSSSGSTTKKAFDVVTASALSAVLALGMAPASAFAAGANIAQSDVSTFAQGGSSGGDTPGGGGQGGDTPGGGGSSTSKFDYTGTYSGVLAATSSNVTSANATLSSTTADQNVVLAQNGYTATVTGATLTKSGSDENGDNCNFYGINSSVLAVGSGSTVAISDSAISSTGTGCNGLFATNSGVVNANNVSILTQTGGNSRGLDATYGGTIVANLMTISTAKDHCASIATDRGGGYVSCTNSVLSTAGSGSPLLYSTGDIEVDNVSGKATGSQIAGMEGLNIIRINNSDLESSNDAISGSDPIKNAVIIYQSTSGDADTSTSDGSDFEASDSTLKSSISGGAFFYVTNTAGRIVLKNTNLDFDSSAVELLHVSGNTSNNWGTSGSNGGKIVLTGIDQVLEGAVYVDSMSTAELYLTEGSTWTGVVASTNATGDGTTATPAKATVNVDSTSTWVVTGDCTVGTLNVAQGGKVVDSSGKTVTIKYNGSAVVSGDSDVAVTVASSYSTSLGANAGSISGASSKLASAQDSFDTLYGTSTAWGTNTGDRGYKGSEKTTDVTKIFSDVEAGAWYTDSIQKVYDLGYMTGYKDSQGNTTTFGTYDTLTRAQAVAVFYNMAGEESTGSSTFPDVASDSWYAQAVAWAADQGIVSGYDNGYFGPDDLVTREQLACMLYAMAKKGFIDISTSYSDGALDAFPDVSSVSSWAAESVKWAVTNGVISGVEVGSTRYLQPAASSQRCVMAAMVSNVLGD